MSGFVLKDKTGGKAKNSKKAESVHSATSEERDYIQKWLKKHKYAVLATSFKDVPWAATVNYTSDNNFNVYIRTGRESTKYKNLIKNPVVSLVIDSQTLEGTVQIQGTATPVKQKTRKSSNVLIKPSFIIYRRMENSGEILMIMLNLQASKGKNTIGEWYKTWAMERRKKRGE